MKKILLCVAVLTLIIFINLSQAKPLEAYINESQDYQKSESFDQAIRVMEEAVKEYPDSASAYTYLGIAISEKAQRLNDFIELFTLNEQSFKMWNKAITLNSFDITARFYRGSWGIMLPKFAGKLEIGIQDMEFITTLLSQAPDPSVREDLVSAYRLLGTGYQKQGEYFKAKQSWQKVIEMIPDSDEALEAQESIDNIITFEQWQAQRKEPDTPKIATLKEKIKNKPDNTDLLIQLANAYIDAENYEGAEKTLKKALALAPENVATYKLLALVLGQISGENYDMRISMDTDFRTNLAFEVMMVLDEIVSLAPDDIEMRFQRGILGIQMPFFVGKLEQAIDDLNVIIQSDIADSIKAEALYWLGFAHQKKAMTYWTEVVTNYSNSEASQFVFDELASIVRRIDISQYKKPILVIEFILGFRDELAPQTAVWLEDKEGNFVKTIYVSGFSGYAKGKQINLPMWSHVSKFVDVDGVTGASINLGHHLYIWDMKNIEGKKVKSGDYLVKVEVSYWPSMQYQRVEAPITLGKKDQTVIVEEGNLIPYLEVKYYH